MTQALLFSDPRFSPVRAESKDELDRYYTPRPMSYAIAQTLARRWAGSPPRHLLESAVGDGSFLDAFERVWPDAHVRAVDLDPDAVGLDHPIVSTAYRGVGFVEATAGWTPLEITRQHACGPHWAIITNPPFAVAVEHLLHAVRIAGRVAFLLPADVCMRSESTGWPGVFEAHGADVYPIQGRGFGDHMREAGLYVVDEQSIEHGVRVLSRERIHWP